MVALFELRIDMYINVQLFSPLSSISSHVSSCSLRHLFTVIIYRLLIFITLSSIFGGFYPVIPAPNLMTTFHLQKGFVSIPYFGLYSYFRKKHLPYVIQSPNCRLRLIRSTTSVTLLLFSQSHSSSDLFRSSSTPLVSLSLWVPCISWVKVQFIVQDAEPVSRSFT